MRFLQPLEDFASNSIETHHLGFEVYYRRSKIVERKMFVDRFAFSRRKTFANVTMFKTNEKPRFERSKISFVFDEISSLRFFVFFFS